MPVCVGYPTSWEKPSFGLSRLVYDEDDRASQFPYHIASTSLRRDAVVCSGIVRRTILIELTFGDKINLRISALAENRGTND